MKRTPFLAGGVFVFFTLTALAQAAAVTSEISAVTVYADRARVTRSGRVTLPAGESEWTFEKLPAGILDDSVQAAGRGLPGIVVLDVATKVTHVANAADPRIQSLETDIAALDRRLKALEDKEKGLVKQGELVEKIENSVTAPPTEKSGARPSFEEWSKLLTFSDETREKLATASLALEDERRQVQAERQAKQADLDRARVGIASGRAYKEVTVRLTSAKSGEVDLGLNYVEWGATWAPSYDARLTTATRQLELSYFGTVRQNTGEDWKNVSLILSTAKPSLGGQAPKLTPWLVDVIRQEPLVAGKLADDEGSTTLSAFSVVKDKNDGYKARSTLAGARIRGQSNDLGSAIHVVTPEFMKDTGATNASGLLEYVTNTEVAGAAGNFDYSAAALVQAATSASFAVASSTTVKSDNTPQKVAIAGGVLPAKLRFESAPRLQETAFLTAEVQNLTDYPFLSGPVSVFLDEAFVANSVLKGVMPGEKFEVAMGADEGLSVKRRVVSRFSEDTGLTGGGRRVTYHFLTTLTNNKKTAETILLRDVIPLSRNEKVVVKLLAPAEKEFSTKDKPRELSKEEEGKLLWTLELKAGEKREVPLKFSIDFPGDVPVTGVE